MGLTLVLNHSSGDIRESRIDRPLNWRAKTPFLTVGPSNSSESATKPPAKGQRLRRRTNCSGITGSDYANVLSLFTLTTRGDVELDGLTLIK